MGQRKANPISRDQDKPICANGKPVRARLDFAGERLPGEGLIPNATLRVVADGLLAAPEGAEEGHSPRNTWLEVSEGSGEVGGANMRIGNPNTFLNCLSQQAFAGRMPHR